MFNNIQIYIIYPTRKVFKFLLMYEQFRDVVKVKTLYKILNDIPSSLHDQKNKP